MDEYFEKDKEYYNFLINNLVYCEDTHSITHRFYNKLRDEFLNIANGKDKAYGIPLNKETFENRFNYKDAQYLMNKVLEEMSDAYDEHKQDEIFRCPTDTTEPKK